LKYQIKTKGLDLVKEGNFWQPVNLTRYCRMMKPAYGRRVKGDNLLYLFIPATKVIQIL